MIRAVLCDIEGTTTSLSFVQDVLFPLSRRQMENFIQDQWNNPDIQTELAHLKNLTGGDASSSSDVVRLLLQWIDADQKETVLKSIQGRIWRKSFESGEIKAPVYPDVPVNFSLWKKNGIALYIFSSGSIEAQRLVFRYSEAGDLTKWIDGYFDTNTGPKKDPESYKKIANHLKLNPDEILFLSDTPAEVEAARAAGMQTVQIDRTAGMTFDDLL